MRPFVPLVAAVAWACASAPAFAGPLAGGCGHYYVWTLSFSRVLPYADTAPAAAGSFEAYLWLACTEMDGMTFAEFDVRTTGGLTITDFVPDPGFQNFGSPTALLLLAEECAWSPVVVGTFTMVDATGAGGAACFARSAAQGALIAVDCDPEPTAWVCGVHGLSTDGSPPCTAVAVEPTSWGRTKALYR